MSSSFLSARFVVQTVSCCCLVLLCLGDFSLAQAKQSPAAVAKRPTQKDTAIVRGKIELRPTKSYTGDKLTIALSEMQAKLREYVDLPAPKTPAGFKDWSVDRKMKWQREFVNSPAGKAHIERNKKLLADANSFDIKFANDGSFVIYDVPAGDYGLQGRIDKKFGEIDYAFEVFGQLTVEAEVDELALAKINVEITPLLKRGNPVPPFSVTTHDDKNKLTPEVFGESMLFISFWSVTPTANAEQSMVQAMYRELKQKYPLRLLSVNVDKDRKSALKFLLENNFREGSHGFTLGLDHPTLINFGVRGAPSFWLIDQKNRVLMSQYEFGQAMRIKPDLKTIVVDRLEGKDQPTLAPEKTPAADEKK